MISGLALVSTVLVAAPATAAPAATSGAESAAGAAALVWDEAAQAKRRVSAGQAEKIVNDYWTKERLASATPADAPTHTTSGRPPVEVKETVTASAPAAPKDASTRDAWFSYTTGKIFFLNPKDNLTYSCSGGAVNTGSKRLVSTAGHCVHTGGSGGAWMLNWIFIPGYDHGSEPRGRFPAYWYHSSTGWTVDGNWQRDFGLVVTYDNGSGQRLVDTVGGHGFRVNGGFSRFVHIAGYPGNRDGGEVQWYCWGTTDQWPSASAYRLGCDFGGGSSGGPWLEDYQPNGLGYVISAMQGLLNGANSGPYYDNHVLDVFNAAKDQTP